MIPDYATLHEFAYNEWQTLRRVRHPDYPGTCLLKTPRAAQPSAADLELLAREFTLLKELDIPGVPRVLDFVRHEQQAWLLLADEGGATLTPATGLGLQEFFDLALQLTALLAELQRREITHNHLNPRALLRHPVTGALTLTDFSLAVRGAAERPPQAVRGSLAYLAYFAPEQTGRMKRAVDYRSDFYALGVVFYELLTGRVPFESDDPLELMHWHIAKPPQPLTELNPNLPAPLNQIVLKLLAKNAEDRYQSAVGLQADLEICARAWATQRRIEAFPLGQHDVADRFIIPHKLYGRSGESAALLGAFERACAGQTSLLLVAGYSGIGKTSLIEELQRPIVQRHGYFCAGKFEQVLRNQPFSALIQALRGLLRQLLGESEAQLAAWRKRLSTALGVNGGVLAEVIPEIELIIGPQPAPPTLAPAEAQNRFQLVFQNFFAALAQPEHPLVLFLDDLQWADAATLGLLQPLLTTKDIQSLLLLGAYRDNEVDAAHPLLRTLKTVETAGGQMQRLTLGPLGLSELAQLICAVLHGELAEAAPLAELVLAKTGGNPFFVTQFLRTLKQEGYLRFEHARGRWAYDLTAIAAAPLTDNVIELLTRKLQRLPAATQHVLTLAACIGNTFDQATLALVSEQSPAAVAADLQAALAEGLILEMADGGMRMADSSNVEAMVESVIVADENPPSAFRHPPSYAFLHDRVQQAAYALIPAERKQSVHLAVGRLLRARATAEHSEERLLAAVQHLNLGSGLITDAAERVTLAQLNLQAGQKAKAATAHTAALDYFQAGAQLLTEENWQSDYDLAFALRLEAAECQRLGGEFAAAEQAYATLLPRARTKLEQARVYGQWILQHENQAHYAAALATARTCLALFGVEFPATAAEQEAVLESEIAAIQTLLDGRPIAALLELPVLRDPAIRMVLQVLTLIWSSAYIAGAQALTRLISVTMVRLSLQHGNAEESAYGYVTHAITVGPLRGDYAACYEFGVLALRVNERFNDARLRAKICQQFQAHVTLWRRPLQTCLDYAREARQSGFENGDFTYGIYGAFTETWTAIVITQDLAQYVRAYAPDLPLFKKLKAVAVADGQQVMLNFARALLGELPGEARAPLSLTDDCFDEEAYVETYRGNPFFSLFYAAAKLQLAYLLGEHAQALSYARQAGALATQQAGTIWTPVCDFWIGLTLAANYAAAAPDERPAMLAEMERRHAALAVLADNCAVNYRCQALLLAAEMARVSGRQLAALDLYEHALQFAEETHMIQHRALTHELLGRFWLQREQPAAAAAFMIEARACYAQWGAQTKVAELERRYAPLFKRFSRAAAPAEAGRTLLADTTVAFDLLSVTKAAQAIAGEMEREQLLATLLRIVLENAGAERVVLLLEERGQAFVHAEGTLEHVTVHAATPLEATPKLPHSVINYVRHTQQSVVLADAQTASQFSADADIQQRQPRSVLCLPVLQQGALGGVLYLENNQVTDAFTPARLQVMQILAAQAAISLENARLYAETKIEMEQRRRAEATLRSITAGTAAVTGGDFFRSMVTHLAAALPVKLAFVTECANVSKTRARMLAFWNGEGVITDHEYEVKDTTCEFVYQGRPCYYPAHLQQLFPKEEVLVELDGQSYIGLPLCGKTGELIGHLAVIDDQPLTETRGAQMQDVLQIFAARASVELERTKAEAELRQALAEIETLKNQLHAENVYLQEEIRHEHNFDEIIGSSPALLTVLQQIELAAPTDATVLILGETGTGKELIARAIHNRSARRDRPLVKVNCGAISAGLVESELFGHVKGAFTGALDKRTGRFELAHGGTLFLDEVGELPPDTQVKLLRVLQEGEFEPVGSNRTVTVDVRIIAATNRDLAAEVKAGRFRADLYYRLNVLPLHNPALRERHADIPQLAMFFLARYAKRFGKMVNGIAQETMEALINYGWPGNVRELQNLIERGVVLATGSTLSMSRELLPVTTPSERPPAQTTMPATPPPTIATPSTASMDEVARQHILAVLEQTGWVIEGAKGAASQLNLHPNTLRSRMKKLGIKRP
ncbi:MAG: sigma 54-interacting transcriptional regulator [Acidobacteria bacterium]|nr:sigma 54-interacting transcriptional regulator [Acidobacteriota bacterium]